jgi:hypothetical protein
MRPRTLLFLTLLALSAVPRPAGAQQGEGVLGSVTAGDTQKPIEGAMVLLLDEAGRRVNGVLSATNGWFRVAAPGPGRYRLRVERIGYLSTDTDLFDVAAGATVERRVVASVRPVQLAQIDVAGGRRCEVRPAEGIATATVWAEARKALEAATWTTELEMYEFAWMTFERSLDASGRRTLKESRSFNRHFTSQPFVAHDPAKLAAGGFVEIPTPLTGVWQYYAPDATVLLSDPFLDTHCMRLERRERDGVRMIGLAFEPIPGRRLPDVRGVIWMDQGSATQRLSIEYKYVNLFRDIGDNHDASGELSFVELPNGTWIVKDWRIRMPKIEQEQDVQGRVRRYVVTAYQDAGGNVRQVQTNRGDIVLDELQGGVHGTVTDSVGRPASGLRVWIEGTEFTTVSDSLGSFSFAGVGKGFYRVATISPALEEAGELDSHADVEVAQTGITEVKLEIPFLGRMLLARCLETPPFSDEAVLAGRVLDATGAPVEGAEVRATWDEVTGGAVGLRMSEQGMAATTDEMGGFTFCTVPTDRSVELRATLGERVSQPVEVPISLETQTVVARVVLP